jgi:hypothetical protein
MIPETASGCVAPNPPSTAVMCASDMRGCHSLHARAYSGAYMRLYSNVNWLGSTMGSTHPVQE